MKKSVRYMALLLAGLLAMGPLTACDNEETETPTQTESTTETETETADTSVTGTYTEIETETESATETDAETDTEIETDTETDTETETGHEHQWGDWDTVTPMTCLADGEEERTCHTCGEKESRVVSSTGHLFGDWYTNGEPTCTEAGEEVRFCIFCVETEYRSVSPLGHTEVIAKGDPPSCKYDGWTDGVMCSVCGAIIKEQELIPSPGHNYQNGVCTVCGAEQQLSKGLTYVSNRDGTCYVSGIGKCIDENLVIPATSPAGDRVTAIGDWAFMGCQNLRSVVIPAGVTHIGVSAFYECSALESVTIPASVTHIGGTAFTGCVSLRSVDLPDSLTYLGDLVFLESAVELETIDGIQYLENWVVSTDRSVTSVTLREGTKGVADGAFMHCEALTDVTLPAGITYIGNYTFLDCYALQSIVVPAGVTYIGESAFEGCYMLEEVTIPASVTRIRYAAFKGCISLNKVIYQGTARQWSAVEVAFSNEYLTQREVEYAPLPHEHRWDAWVTVTAATCTVQGEQRRACAICREEEVVSIDALGHSFQDGTCTRCGEAENPVSTGLAFGSNGDGTCYVSGMGTCTDVHLIIPTTSPKGDRVTAIGKKAFYERDTLISVTVPEGVTEIREYAFSGCHSLTTASLPAGLLTVGEGAFWECTDLHTVNLPDSVTYIGHGAFIDCTDLQAVRLPASLTYISSTSFYGSDVIFEVENGVHYKDGWVMGYEEYMTELTVREGTVGLSEQAFVDGEMTSITLPASLKYVCGHVFLYCHRLENLVIPDGVLTIGDSAFHGCRAMKTLVLPASLTTVGKGMFSDCVSLKNLYYAGTKTQWRALELGAMDEETLRKITVHYEWTGGTPHTHVWGAWAVTTPAGCLTDGQESSTCSVCGQTRTRPVDATGHTPTVVEGYAATCTAAGLTDGEVCATCGAVLTAQQSIPVLGHDWGEWVTVTPPTCVAEGQENSTCANCGQTRTRTVKPLDNGHIETTVPGYPATCTETGRTDEIKCSVCGTVFQAAETISALGHRWGVLNIISDATCTKDGEASQTCQACGVTHTSVVTAFGHDYVDGSCIRCGEKEPIYSKGLVYESLGDGTCVVTGMGTCTDAELIIPATSPEGWAVVQIAKEAFMNQTGITHVTVPGSLVYMGNNAFKGCTGLVSVYLEDGANLGLSAFKGCTSLTTVRLPEGMGGIAAAAFENCSSLTAITIPYGPRFIGVDAFRGCTSLGYVLIPKTVTSISENAFADCSSLGAVFYAGEDWRWEKSVKLESGNGRVSYPVCYRSAYTAEWTLSFTSYGNGTCYVTCDKLATSPHLVIPAISPDGDTVIEIRYSSFDGCEYLEKVTLPDTLEKIGDNAFANCPKLTEIVIPDGVTSIGSTAFRNCIALERVQLPKSLEYVGSYTFAYCWKLSDLHLPDGVIEVEQDAFLGCPLIEWENGVAYVDGWAVGSDKNVTQVSLRQGTVGIAWHAFDSRSLLTSVTLPDGMKYICSAAFHFCEKLAEVRIPRSVISLGGNVFGDCPLVYREENGIRYVDGWVIGGDPVGDVVLPADTKGIAAGAFYYCRQLTSIVIPEGVKVIGKETFSGCPYLHSVVLPSTLTFIGDLAFYDSGLSSINLPDGVTYIGRWAFADTCLNSIVIPDSVTELGWGAFKECTQLQKVVISGGITAIREKTFEHCYWLKEIVISDTVTVIEYCAFDTCERLTDIVFKGTKAQWESITKSYAWDSGTETYTVHCSDGDVSA